MLTFVFVSQPLQTGGQRQRPHAALLVLTAVLQTVMSSYLILFILNILFLLFYRFFFLCSLAAAQRMNEEHALIAAYVNRLQSSPR